MNEHVPKSMVPGRVLYRAIGTGESEPFMVRWIVSSIEPYKGEGLFKGAMTVYVKTHPDDKDPVDGDCLTCLSFPLSRWPHNAWLCATERAAWRACLRDILRELSDSMRHKYEAIKDGDDEMVTEWARDITRLTKHAELVKKRISP